MPRGPRSRKPTRPSARKQKETRRRRRVTLSKWPMVKRCWTRAGSRRIQWCQRLAHPPIGNACPRGANDKQRCAAPFSPAVFGFPQKSKAFPQGASRDPARADGRRQSLGNGPLPLDDHGPRPSLATWQSRRHPKAKWLANSQLLSHGSRSPRGACTAGDGWGVLGLPGSQNA